MLSGIMFLKTQFNFWGAKSISTLTLHYIFIESNSKKIPIVYHEERKINEREHYHGDKNKELPIYQTVDLAERYYGELQGLNKAKTMEKYGKEQVHLWRRSFDVKPPGGESLKNTSERSIPYFKKHIINDLKDDKTVLTVAHGNSLRAIVMYIEKISANDVPNLEIPTGIPIVYTFDKNMKLKEKNFL